MSSDLSLFTRLRLAICALILRIGMILASGPAKPSTVDEIIQVPTRDADRTMKVHVYKPRDLKLPCPVLINYHGSGFVIPRHGEDDEYCRRMSDKTGHIVLDCPYRLAPEHPYPAAVHDVEDMVRWVLSQSFQFDLARLSISGFSAGGNLALVASAVLFPKDTFKSVTTFYPCTNMTIPAKVKVRGPDPSMRPGLPPILQNMLISCYLPFDHPNYYDPQLSPHFADMDRFPQKVVMITAAGDNLCQEAEAFIDKLVHSHSKRSRHVVLRRMENCNHGFDKWTRVPGTFMKAAKDEAYDLVVETLSHLYKS